MTDGRIETGDGCVIGYRWDGDPDRPVLLLANSIATDLHMWDGVVADLCRTHRVLRYDMRGHGGSGVTPGAYSLDRLGRDVVELLDGLGVERVDFCGLSLGGMVGQWLGVHAPDRIDRLLLSHTAAYLGPAGQWDDHIAALGTRPDMPAMAAMFMGNWFSEAFVADRPDIVDRFRYAIEAMSPHGLAGCFAAVRDMDLRRTDTLITRPTLVIAGEGDIVTRPEHARAIAAAISFSSLVMLPGTHMPVVEDPALYVETVGAFLTR